MPVRLVPENQARGDVFLATQASTMLPPTLRAWEGDRDIGKAEIIMQAEHVIGELARDATRTPYTRGRGRTARSAPRPVVETSAMFAHPIGSLRSRFPERRDAPCCWALCGVRGSNITRP